MMLFSVLHGDSPAHVRMHGRLLRALPGAPAKAFWCNGVSGATLAALAGLGNTTVHVAENTPKYQALRAMFASMHDEGLICYFDDDTDLMPGWFEELEAFLAGGEHGYVGGDIREARHEESSGLGEWVKRQDWYAGRPFHVERFCVKSEPPTYTLHPFTRYVGGAFWVVRASLMKALDWPPPSFKWRGGDRALGEAMHQLGVEPTRCPSKKIQPGVNRLAPTGSVAAKTDPFPFSSE